MLIFLKFHYMQYKIERVTVLINNFYLCACTKLIIYVIVTDFLIIQYILFHNIKKHIICKKNYIYNMPIHN